MKVRRSLKKAATMAADKIAQDKANYSCIALELAYYGDTALGTTKAAQKYKKFYGQSLINSSVIGLSTVNENQMHRELLLELFSQVYRTPECPLTGVSK